MSIPYQGQFDAQLALLDQLAKAAPELYSPQRTAIAIARMELMRGGPGNTGSLSTFLKETARQLLEVEQAVCAIPHKDKEQNNEVL
jgi:hypothetical protein